MESVVEKKNSASLNGTITPLPQFKDGINTVILLLFSCFTIHWVLDNYATYGIIRSPYQLSIDFYEHVFRFGWVYVTVYSITLSKIIVCYTIEKLLVSKILSDSRGMVLHAANALIGLNLGAILCTLNEFGAHIGIIIMAHLFFNVFRFWMYAFENRKHRLLLFKHEKENGKTEDISTQNIVEQQYPHNVTLLNLVEFILFTSHINYKVGGFKRQPRNLKKAIKRALSCVIFLYTVAFITYQYIFPEADKTVKYFQEGDYLRLMSVSIRLAFPVLGVWILYFYVHVFKYLMLVMCPVWGVEEAQFAQDWWNSENSTVFWTKWNVETHIALKNIIFIPLLRKGYSKKFASTCVAIISGILHEYLITIASKTGYGLGFFGMVVQIPIAIITTYMHKTWGPKWGNLALWISLAIGEVGCFLIIYYRYVIYWNS